MPHATAFDAPMVRDWDAPIFPTSSPFSDGSEKCGFFDSTTLPLSPFESTIDPSLLVVVEVSTGCQGISRKRSMSMIDGDEQEHDSDVCSKKLKACHGQGDPDIFFDSDSAPVVQEYRSDEILSSTSSACYPPDQDKASQMEAPFPADTPPITCGRSYQHGSRPLHPSPLSSSICPSSFDDDMFTSDSEDDEEIMSPPPQRSPSPPRNSTSQLELVKLALDPWLKLYRSLQAEKDSVERTAIVMPNPAIFPRCGNIRDLRNPFSSIPPYPVDPTLTHC
jgi:hypothetical protein